MKIRQGLKKIVALCIALVMVLGSGVPAVANAQEGSNVIDVVEVNGVQEAAVGVAVTSETFTIPEGANYSFNSYDNGWCVEGELGYYSWVDNGTVLETGKKYMAKVNIVPNEGYVLTEETIMKINGEVVDTYINLDTEIPYIVWSEFYSFYEQVDKVEINNVPTAEIGGTATTAGITVAQDAGYEITHQAWYEVPAEGDHVQLEEGTVFEKGKRYRLQMTIAPKEGFEFSEGYEITVNGEIPDEHWGSNFIYAFQNYSFLDKIDKIEINNVPTAEIGGTATVEGITIPEGANYEISDISWYNYTKDEYLEQGDVFEKGNIYNLGITIHPTSGYEFTEDTVVIADGLTLMYEGYYVSEQYAEIWKEYSFAEKINKVEIDNAPMAEIGKEATVEGITVPEGANYKIDYEYTKWYNDTTGEEVTSFADGNKYSLCISLVAEDGYEFAEDAVVLVNGEEEYEEVYLYGQWGEIYCEYSFLEQIDKIEIIDELPDAEVGETADAGELEVAENAKYSASYAWVTGNLDSGMELLLGTFEAGKAYMLAVSVEPDKGCEFAEEVAVTIAGKPVDSIFITNQGNLFIVMETHDLGENTIDKIEIVATEPKAGEKISVDNVKVPEDAKYEIVYAAWCDAKTGRELKGTFKEGKQYQLMVVIQTEEGIYLSNNVKIMLNGQEFAGAKFDNNTLAMPFLAVCELGFDLTVADNSQNNNIQNNVSQNTVITPSPKTGDNSNMILWVALAVIAMIGMAVVVSKRRYEV